MASPIDFDPFTTNFEYRTSFEGGSQPSWLASRAAGDGGVSFEGSDGGHAVLRPPDAKTDQGTRLTFTGGEDLTASDYLHVVVTSEWPPRGGAVRHRTGFRSTTTDASLAVNREAASLSLADADGAVEDHDLPSFNDYATTSRRLDLIVDRVEGRTLCLVGNYLVPIVDGVPGGSADDALDLTVFAVEPTDEGAAASVSLYDVEVAGYTR